MRKRLRMSDTARKILGASLAVACILAALIGTRLQAQANRAQAEAQARAAAQEQLARAEAALAEEAQLMGRRAESGARTLNVLMREAVVSDDASRLQLAATIADVIQNEAWYEPYRRLGHEYFFLGGQPVIEVRPGEADVVAPLVRDAETSGHAAAWGAGEAGPVLVAAGRVPDPNVRQERGVVVIVSPVDAAVVGRAAEKAGGALAVVGGGQTLAAGEGHEQLTAYLSARRPAADTCCAVKPLGLGVEVAVWANPTAPFVIAAQDTSRAQLVGFGLAGLLAVGALVFGFKKSSGNEQERLLRETAAQLEAQRAELQRLSQHISNPNVALNPGAVNTGLAHGLGPGDDALAATSATAVPSRYEEVAPLG